MVLADTAQLMASIANTAQTAAQTAASSSSSALDRHKIGDIINLSEAQALWALGEQKVAVRSVEALVKALPDSRDDRDEMLLIWASRAAALGETDIARSLLTNYTYHPNHTTCANHSTCFLVHKRLQPHTIISPPHIPGRHHTLILTLTPKPVHVHNVYYPSGHATAAPASPRAQLVKDITTSLIDTLSSKSTIPKCRFLISRI